MQKTLICPHCKVLIYYQSEPILVWTDGIANREHDQPVHGLEFSHCAQCHKLIVFYIEGTGYLISYDSNGYANAVAKLVKKESRRQFFPEPDPEPIIRAAPPEVPEYLRKNYSQAVNTLAISPESSAALSRRILQIVLREDFGIQHHNLVQEIEEFIGRDATPSYLADAVDAIRMVGNFAAHPTKSTSTGEIVDVEPGEAEWLLDILDSLFDFTFVQPKRLEEKRNALNQKLQDLGKPQMKVS